MIIFYKYITTHEVVDQRVYARVDVDEHMGHLKHDFNVV